MEEEENLNVFVSTVPISRYDCAELYELIETTPAEPIKRIVNSEVIKKFEPTEKIHITKKVCKKKVRTVQQIRQECEDYTYEYLPTDLEKQHKYIYDKICRGASREEHNIEFVRKLLKSSNPMLRSTWQMLSNMNIEDNAYPQQYISCNGKDILINGSKGGSKKHLCNFMDIKSSTTQIYSNKTCKKRGLLNTSLNVKFRPGPLAKKEALDTSFQKFTIGTTALKPLPEIGLEITTTYGVPLNPHLYGFIQNSQAVDGVLTEEWINFAASALKLKENEENAVSTFKLKYKNDQKRLLVRENNKNVQYCENIKFSQTDHNISSKSVFDSHSTEDTVKSIINDLMTAVEVNLAQHSFILDDDNIATKEVPKNPSPLKDRTSKKSKELKKLDVTIIYVGDNSTGVEESECSKPYCTLGCICSSLQCKLHLKNHCSLAECMFNCKCNYKKHCEGFNDLAGLIDFDNKINLNLAKEEQKFHHTVVFTEGKGTVLSAKHRTSRATKKCEKYTSSVTEKLHEKHKELLISIPNIDCSNVETWCMVHELYRCFCKGKFLVKPNVVDLSVVENNETTCEVKNDLTFSKKNEEKLIENNVTTCEVKNYLGLSQTNEEKLVENNVTTCEVKNYLGLSQTNEEKRVKNNETTCEVKNDLRLSKTNEERRVENNEKTCEVKKDLRVSKTNEEKVKQIERQDKRRDEIKNKKPVENVPQDQEIEEIIDVISFEPSRQPNNASPSRSEYTMQSEGDDESQDAKISSSELDETFESSCRTRPFSRKKGSHEIEMFGNDGGYIDSKLPDTPKSPNTGHSVLPSKRFATWLEKCYKLLKDRMDEGKAIILEKPIPKRVSLFPWTALLKRYQTRSNFFLVNRSPPHRIVIAVDPNDADFKNYTDINYLRVDELPSLPYYVRHLVTGTDLFNNFVILRGYRNCWQILGSVSKNNERTTPPTTPMNVFQSTTVPLKHPKISSHLYELLQTEGIKSGEDSSMKERRNLLDEIVSSSLPSVAQDPAMTTKLTTYTNNTIDSLLVPSTKKRKRSRFRLSRDKRSARSAPSKKLKANPSSSINTRDKLHNKSKPKTNHTKEHIGAGITRTSVASNNTSVSSSVENLPHRSKRKPNLLTKTERKKTSSKVEEKTSEQPVSIPGALADSNSLNSSKVEEKTSEQPVSNPGALADSNSLNSKWFVMTVENDFKQLQFYNKNVFVTYKTITSAIELARSSEQTVILPLSKMKSYNDNGPQFGIYAMPVKDRACVLIGPYEKYEDLCMKTVKELNSHVPKTSTRGVWLMTKKVDNSSVLEDPLSYLPQYSNKKMSHETQNLSLPKDKELLNVSKNSHLNLKMNSGIKRKMKGTEMVAIAKKIKKVETASHLERIDSDALLTSLNLKQSNEVQREAMHGGVTLKTAPVVMPKEMPIKRVVKPITIKRSNGFYQLAFNDLYKTVSLIKPTDIDSSTSGLHNIVPIQSVPSLHPKPVITKISSLAPSTMKKVSPLKLTSILKSPMKTTQITANTVANSISSNKGGFFVLKPEEINNKSFHHPIHTHANVILNEETENGITANTSKIVQTKLANSNLVLDSKNTNSLSTKETIVEIERCSSEEKTLEEKSVAQETSVEQHSSDGEVYVLSDDDDSPQVPSIVKKIAPTPSLVEDVMIECVDIPNLGCIPGRLNANNKVSFQFPGFKHTDFYSEEEASVKINQVLSRKVFVPKSLTLKWQVSRDKPNKMLSSDQLGPQFVVTKRGLVHKLKLSTTVAPNVQHST